MAYPKRDHNFDNHPYDDWSILGNYCYYKCSVLSTLDPLTFLLFVQHHYSKADVGMTSRHPFLSDGKGEELAELLLGSFHGI